MIKTVSFGAGPRKDLWALAPSGKNTLKAPFTVTGPGGTFRIIHSDDEGLVGVQYKHFTDMGVGLKSGSLIDISNGSQYRRINQA